MMSAMVGAPTLPALLCLEVKLLEFLYTRDEVVAYLASDAARGPMLVVINGGRSPRNLEYINSTHPLAAVTWDRDVAELLNDIEPDMNFYDGLPRIYILDPSYMNDKYYLENPFPYIHICYGQSAYERARFFIDPVPHWAINPKAIGIP